MVKKEKTGLWKSSQRRISQSKNDPFLFYDRPLDGRFFYGFKR